MLVLCAILSHALRPFSLAVAACVNSLLCVWEFSHPIADVEPEDGTAAVRASWFGCVR
jgi:hypothetical protein